MLSPTQLAARAGKLTASRIACLMKGDAVEIMDLWRELTDDPEWIPEDLSTVWPVRLGETTEPLNLEWFERTNGTLSRQGEVVVHPKYPWGAATLDGWCNLLACPVECKHVGGREPIEVVVDRYQPQMQWQMACTGANECALSVIVGVSPPIVEFIPRDEEYIAEMVRRGAQFMKHVENRTPPVVLDAVPAPIDASKVYDMTGSNEWANAADLWIMAKPSADRAKEAEKVLKAMVPADAKKVSGHGVRITRDRAGRLSLREDEAQ